MNKSPLPYKQVLFVCTNTRKPGERISCAGEGRCGEQVLETLKRYVKEKGLAQIARAAKSGCQEKCEIGPSIMAFPQNEFLSAVTPEDAGRIIETYLAPLVPPEKR